MVWKRPKEMPKAKLTYKPVKDIVEYKAVDKVTSFKNEDEFVVEKVIVEDRRYNRQDFINSFRDDVGIENVLKKVQLTGDATLLNQRPRQNLPVDETGKEIVQDFTPIDSVDGLASVGDKARMIWKNLPAALKAGRTYEEFVQTITPSEIDAFVKSMMPQEAPVESEVK